MLGAAEGRFEHLAMSATVPIGRLRFDPDRLVLYDGTEVVPLAPLPAQVLAKLVHANGEVIDAISLRQSLWGDAAVEERNLNQQMYVLRRVLRRDPQIAIENVPRRGYRLVVTSLVAVPATRTRLRIQWAGAFAAVVISAVFIAASGRVPMQTSSSPPVDRDLALASYLSTSEGPGNLDDAARYYRALIAKAPNEAAGYGGLAFVDAKIAIGATGDDRAQSFEAARMEAAAALRRDPNESNALTALGIVASVDEHRNDLAKQFFDAAVGADPTAESPRAWRGKFRLSIGDFRGAGCDFRTVSLDVPTSGSAVGLYGEWLVLDRDYSGATAVLSQALDLGYHPGFTRYWLARSYYERGLDTQALRLSNEILALYPGEASALALRLRVETSLGEKKAALADLDQIEKIRDPNRYDAIALASAEIAMGNKSEALEALRTFESSGQVGLDDIARIRTDPDFDSLRTGFNQIVSL